MTENTRQIRNLALACLAAGVLAFVFSFCIATVAGASVPSTVRAPFGVAYSTLGNNTESDCTVAAAGDLVDVWDYQRGVIDTRVVADVQHVWNTLGHPSQGLVPQTLLDYWTTHAIDGYKITYTNQGNATKSTIESDVVRYSGAYIQVHFSNGFMKMIDTNSQATWRTQGNAGANVNFHQIDVVGYSHTGVSIATWGEVYHASWNWLLTHQVQTFEVSPVR
jgi:hypothetical protein